MHCVSVFEFILEIPRLPALFMAWLLGNWATETTLPEGPKVVKLGLMDKLDEILRLLRAQTTLEARQAQSEFVEAEVWPKGLVLIRDHRANSIGMGFITVIENKHLVITAAHVLSRCTRGLILSAGCVQQKHVTITQDAKLVLKTSSDIVGFEVPPNTMATLGVSKVKLGQTPSQGLPVSVFGFFKGQFVSALGVMGKPTRGFYFQHGCSTIGGFSGTPIYKDGVIVGIHSRASGSQENYGLSLDFLITKLESKDYDGARHMREVEEWDPDFYLDMSNREQEDIDADVDDFQWEFEKRAGRRARTTEKTWMQTPNLASLFTEENNRISGFNYVDSERYQMEHAPSVSAGKLPVFHERPSHSGAQPTTNGSRTPKKEETTTSTESENLTSSTQEEKVTPENPPKKKKKKSKSSKPGNGQRAQSTPSEAPSGNTPPASTSDPGNPRKKASSGSGPKSWVQVYTQELLRLRGTGVGLDQEEEMTLAALAQSQANKIWKDYLATRSPKSGQSSKQTS